MNPSLAALLLIALAPPCLRGQQSRPASEPTRLERLRDHFYRGGERSWSRSEDLGRELVRSGDLELAHRAIAACLEDEAADDPTLQRALLLLNVLLLMSAHEEPEGDRLNERLVNALRHAFVDRARSSAVRSSAIHMLWMVHHEDARMLEGEVAAELERIGKALARGDARQDETEMLGSMSLYLSRMKDPSTRSVRVLAELGADRQANKAARSLPMRLGFEVLTLLPAEQQIRMLARYVEAYRDPEVARVFDCNLPSAARFFHAGADAVRGSGELREFTALVLDRIRFWATTTDRIPAGTQDALARFIEQMCDVIAGDRELLERYRQRVEPHAATFWAAPFRAPKRVPR